MGREETTKIIQETLYELNNMCMNQLKKEWITKAIIGAKTFNNLNMYISKLKIDLISQMDENPLMRIFDISENLILIYNKTLNKYIS